MMRNAKLRRVTLQSSQCNKENNMTIFKALTLDSPSHNFAECIIRMDTLFPKLSKIQKYYISLWWCGKLPKIFRPIVSKVLYRVYN